ncbi:MAG: OmpA family protein [Bacteroidales bacterium]|nr:OmpA family protein [Bacteroidales bacterium]MCF8338664.1 OmpA family protein [Bacteroidales bacterium]
MIPQQINEAPFISVLLFFLAVFTFNSSLAQDKEEENGKEAPNRHLEAAHQAYEHQQYSVAIEKYKEGYSKLEGRKYDLKGKISYRIGESYRKNGAFRRARLYYYRAIRFEYHTQEPKVYLYYAQMLQMNEDYEEAITAYNNYLEYKPDSEIAEKGIKSCQLTQKWKENPTGFTVENPYRINSGEDDFAPTYADKYHRSIIFTSNREGTTGEDIDPWTDKPFSDLFYAKKNPEGRWNDPALIDKKENVNTKVNEGAPELNSEFNKLYFTRCFKRKDKKAGCKIFVSKRSGMNWGKPKSLDLGHDSADIVGHPTINDDETLIIFAADLPGGEGKKDLWYAKKDGSNGKYNRPVNLGETINTAGNELFPFLRNDSTLYFSSNGHIGMGGLDIFKTTKREGEWQKPVNMKYPINSIANDFGITMQKDRKEGYLSSNRRGSRGGDDIFYFINPPVEITLRGNVKDKQSLQPVEEAEVKLSPVNSESNQRAVTNSEGFFQFGQSQIEQGNTYTLEISKTNYFNIIDTIDTQGITESKDLEKNYTFERIPDKPIVLPDILYDLGKWELKEQYQDSLQGLIERLDRNKKLVVELGAHTDARASEEYNDVLSQKRAESVVDYLIKRGIDGDRLVAKGYGEKQPRTLRKTITEDSITFEKGTTLTESFIDSLPTEKHKELAHQLNRRTDFSIIRKDFKPKESPQKEKDKKNIGIVKDPGVNKVNYILGKGDEITIPVIINGYTYKVAFSKSYASLYASDSFVMQLLERGVITKEAFPKRARRALERGNIRNMTEINLDEVRIGSKKVNDIKMTASKNFDGKIRMGPQVLKNFGDYTIDEENFQIIFKD